MSKNNNLLLPKLVQQTKPLTYTLGVDARIWGQIFASLTHKKELDSGYVSRFITGKRPISHPYIKYYADIANPREPTQLLRDLETAMTYIKRTQDMIAALVDYIDTYIDPVDHPSLIPTEQPLYPTQADAAKLWTRVLWYTMCHDYATT